MRELGGSWAWVVLATVIGLTACGEHGGTPQGAAGEGAVGEDPELQVLAAQARSHAELDSEPRAPSLDRPFTRAQYEVVRALCMLDWRAAQTSRHPEAGARIGTMRRIRALAVPAPMRARVAALAPREWSFELALRDEMLSAVTSTREARQRLARFSLIACAPLFDRWNAYLTDPTGAPAPDTEPTPPELVRPQGDFSSPAPEHLGLGQQTYRAGRYCAEAAARSTRGWRVRRKLRNLCEQLPPRPPQPPPADPDAIVATSADVVGLAVAQLALPSLS